LSASQSADEALDSLLPDKAQVVRDIEPRVPVLNAYVRSDEMCERLPMPAGTHAQISQMPVEASAIRTDVIPALQLA